MQVTPPFFGTKVVTDIELDDIYKLIDIQKQKALPAFEEWKKRCRDDAILEPKVVYGYFSLQVYKFASLQVGGKGDFFPLQLVTVGSKVVEKCQWLFAAHKYVDYHCLHGVAAATAEALAEYWHRKILRELEVPFNAGKRLPVGSRISPGYKVWPNLSDQKEICRLLDIGRIGVSVTEAYQLVPEYSTSAMIVLV